MKRIYLVAVCVSMLLPFLSQAGNPPGMQINDRSLFIPARFVNEFINCSVPDSARIGFTRVLPELSEVKDSSSLLHRTLVLKNRLGTKGELQEYRSLLTNLASLGYPHYFTLFYKGYSNRVYKLKVYKAEGGLIRELTLVDPASRLVEETLFYQGGNVMSHTQYKIRDTSSKALAGWTSATLLREGKKTGFYLNGNLRSVHFYTNNKLQDTSYQYGRNGEIITREIWKSDSLVARIEGEKTIIKNNSGSVVTRPIDLSHKAFLVGVDLYNKTVPGSGAVVVDSTIRKFANLEGCVNDVELLAKKLKNHRGFDNKNIMSVTNEEATREGLIRSIRNFIYTLNAGDHVFLHFSGSGTTVPGIKKPISNVDVAPEFGFACSDVNRSRYEKGFNGYLRRSEMEEFFKQIRKKIGRLGQLIISIDACESGGAGSKTTNTGNKNNTTTDLRGESSDILFNFATKESASTAFFTASTGAELSWEMQDDNGITYGLYSFHLANALESPTVSTTRDLFEELIGLLQEYSIKKYGSADRMRQNPDYFTNYDFALFETDQLADQTVAILPEVKQAGNAYVLSVGISDYRISPVNPKLKFKNCVNDAKGYAEFFKTQFSDIDGDNKFNAYLLTDTAATYKNIMKAINEIIFNSKPNDYFVLNFSGYCRQLNDSSGKRVTYFVPYGLKNIADTNEIKTKEKGIPLSQLKDLLQLIPANNQLFITEAGSTSAFQKEFIQALIESSPTIAALSNKNRVFMVPRSSGLDKFTCSNKTIEHGPLNYYITNLNSELNVYGIFQSGIYADAVKYSINKTEVDCDFFRTGYFDIFFEKEYISDLQHFLPEELSQSRGLGVNREAKAALAVGNSKRYALVVGTDKYQGKPDWSDLRNPVLDAKDIATELEQGFGYSVKLLLDKPMDSIYTHIAWLSKTLKMNDQLIIYIAGHGDFDSSLLDDGFIVCRDSKPINQDPYRNSYIQYSKFSRMINRLPAKQILMALDVCFGGTFDQRVIRGQGRDKTPDYQDLSNINYMAAKLKKTTRLYLTSGGKDVVPDGLDKKHSPFALRLLQAFQGRGGASKMLTAKNLHQFVEKLPSGPLLGSFGDDEVGSEFILLGN